MSEQIHYYGLLALTFLFAGAVKGVTGMGLPTVAMGVLGAIISPPLAAALLVMPSFVTNVWQIFSGPAVACLLRRLWPMLSAIVAGSMGGAALLVSIDPLWSSFGLGATLLAYAGYALFAPEFSVPPHIEPWMSPAAGLLTGAITGATGVFVMPAVPYLGALRLEKDELVQALGVSFTVSTVALAAGLIANGAFHVDQLGLSAMAIAPALVGMRLGALIRARISPVRFRQCFLLFLALLGLELVSRPFF
ncbi:sulfite exporter TauE/SafE family protein [Castellaniella sp.]|uniref:sulfite exporter TauE/SafE family protein n=1 Tax=Castellaniella sp. TaxID=1955812 RepID=UPI003C77AE51